MAKGRHHALCPFLVLAPLAGYLASAFTPCAIKVFGIELPCLFAANESFNGLFKLLHPIVVWGEAGLNGLVKKRIRRGALLCPEQIA